MSDEANSGGPTGAPRPQHPHDLATDPTVVAPPDPGPHTGTADTPGIDGAADPITGADPVTGEDPAAGNSTPRTGWRAKVHDFRQTTFWKWARWPAAAGAGVFVLLSLLFVFLYLTVDLPDEPPSLESSAIVDAKGREVAVLAKDEFRVPVELTQVAPVVVDALIASEDRRFYEHGGIDPIGIARAVVNGLRGGRTQGGSTLTQQLVKNSWLGKERTLSRKLKEGVLAIKLDRSMDKDEIIERYLNIVYFGRGAYGIEAAARVYFDTTAEALNAQQAALLVGLLQAPESADPTTDADEATRRRNLVLDAMTETGRLQQADAEAAKAQPLGATAVSHPVTLTAGVAPHFVEWIRQEAVNRFGAQAVYGGGLKITTTLDIDDQVAAEQAIAGVLKDPADPQAALVALDQEGRIKAYVGGRDYNALKVDLARGVAGGGSGRQPGSTFKPFVLATALQHDITLGSTYLAPASITLDANGEPWKVDNYGGEDYGVVDLTTATANSINTVYAQLMLAAGPADVADLAAKAGITTPLEPNPSLALGTAEVTVLDMAGSYLTFAREGDRATPFAIVKVENADGRVLFQVDAPETARAFEVEPARAVNYALQQVIGDGTGTAAQLDRPVAGKTGTTQNNGDAWFAGYTPNYAAVVWMGYPESNEKSMTGVEGVRAVTGGTLPAKIWKAFMANALTDVEKAKFAPPPEALLQKPSLPKGTITVSPASGPPGTEVRVEGAGFARCLASWSVTMAPGVTSAPETMSAADQRGATLVVPADAAPGPHGVTVACDAGGGVQTVAEGSFEVVGVTTTTTTQPPSSTTTRPGGGNGSTTTSSTTTTTEKQVRQRATTSTTLKA